MGRTDVGVTTDWLLNQGHFQGVYCNTTDHCFYTIWFAIHTINSLEITLILRPPRSDVKVGPNRAHGNRLFKIWAFQKVES